MHVSERRVDTNSSPFAIIIINYSLSSFRDKINADLTDVFPLPFASSWSWVDLFPIVSLEHEDGAFHARALY